MKLLHFSDIQLKGAVINAVVQGRRRRRCARRVKQMALATHVVNWHDYLASPRVRDMVAWAGTRMALHGGDTMEHVVTLKTLRALDVLSIARAVAVLGLRAEEAERATAKFARALLGSLTSLH